MKAEAVYRALLRIYPKSFREDYGEAMVVHFEDLWRDASGVGRVRFWARILVDTFVSALRTRFSEKQSTGVAELKVMKVPTFRFLFLAFLFPLLAGVAMFVWLQPRIYMAMARIDVEKVSGVEAPNYDPYFLQTQFEVLKSAPVLGEVVTRLDLGKRFGEEFGRDRLRTEEATEILRSRLELRQSRGTTLVELRAYSEDASLAAAIANETADVYRAKVAGKATVDVVDRTERPLRPVRPNVILNLVLGGMMSLAMAGLGAAGTWLALGRRGGSGAGALAAS